ncbi:hypothetical protein HK098_000170 [Nowakowskiella sp. JEL0407]|nr:hypothetical protein HK098_000170 [Nowakowskiella sp. JEL0407]
MYGSPLSTMYQVVRTRNSASISFPYSIASLLNGTFWGIYGVAISDAFIAAPNLAGAGLAILQLILRVIFPARPVAIPIEDKSEEESKRPSLEQANTAVSSNERKSIDARQSVDVALHAV